MRNVGEVDDRAKIYDKIFENEVNYSMQKIEISYEQMKFRDVVKEGLHEFQHL